jgi:PAS domain S-box-containing protein
MCLSWRPGLIALHVGADAAIALSYFAIPVVLAVFVHRRKDLNGQHRAIAILFAVFITACGLTHVMGILVLWLPYYDLEGVIKAVTAVASVSTALVLPFLIPQLLRIPSPKALALEIASHKKTLAALEEARRALAQRVISTEGDLLETTRRFEAAISSSPVTVFEQDERLAYTWAYNPPLGLSADAMIGGTESDFFSSSAAAALRSLNQQALDTRRPQRGEVQLSREEAMGWFDIRVEPIRLRDGRSGVIATAADITILKLNEERLRLLMRELNHRSKNLLTIVLSIVRQTARPFRLPDGFMARLEDRLSSLASAHDVLAREDWRGADLENILRAQLKHQIDTFGDRITITGGPFQIPPEAAHYIGMALHELGSNAVKYGALSGDHGAVTIAWSASGGPDGSEFNLEWTESGGPPVGETTRKGFGSLILTRLAPSALCGVASLDLNSGGVRWTLKAPVPASALAPAAALA